MKKKVDLIWQLVTTSPVVGLRSSKALPIAKLVPKNGHGHCLGVCCQSTGSSFLNPGETIAYEKCAQEINEMHWKFQCSQSALVSRKGPILPTTTLNHMSHNQCFKSWTNWATKFCLIHVPSAYRLPLLQGSLENFLQEKQFQNLQETENAFWEFVKSQSTGF